MRSLASLVLLVAGLLLPLRARAQASEPPPTSARSSSAGSGTSAAPRVEETHSETGGSSARITRGADPTARPVASERAATDEETLPVQEEDDGRKADFIWLEVEGGISHVDLIAFSQENFSTPEGVVTTPSFTEVRGTGPSFGVALGFRVFFLAVGARATIASYPGFELGTVGGEVQLRLPTPVVEPWVRVGAGYAWQGSANYADAPSSTTNVYGWALNAAIGLDVFVTWWLSFGIGGGIDYLNMTRQSDPRAMCMGVTDFCPEREGDAIGLQGRGTIQVGLHF